MKKLFLCVLCAYLLCACSNSQKENKSEAVRLVEIYPQVAKIMESKLTGDTESAENMLNTLKNEDVSNEMIDDVFLLITRATLSGYGLILPDELNSHKDEFIIISTLPRGIYNLGLIPNAKHFEFALSPTPNENGSEWNWEADAFSRPQKDFIKLLGEDKNAKIVFYDSGEHIFAPMGSAHLGIMWAQHLGYTQLYRLVGGFNAWKDLRLPVTTEAPHCCNM